MSKSLDRIRTNLIERGLLKRDGDRYTLTDAGHAECERLMGSLPCAPVDGSLRGKGVKWDMRWSHERHMG